MLFNSFAFLIFFPIVVGVYFLLPHKFRWFWLLLASCFFYMSFIPIYILILAFTILIDYSSGLLMQKAQKDGIKKVLLIASILANIGVLAFFKYANFALLNLNALANVLHWNYSINLLHIILPIGLSFHTFQSLSYVIEVYRGNQIAEKNLGIFALYVMFYPQLVAGPIERPQNLLHQFKEKHTFDYNKTVSGLKLMTLGFFKKTVLADRLAEYVNLVYNNIDNYEGWQLIISTIFFAFQIYYDFSAYSDIARGAARVMGFELMLNFNNPYQATSISDFWKRWHISLSSWFRDYVYIPLGGNRVKKLRYSLNIMIVFLLSGLWHGANWTYVLWGGLNGTYLIISHLTETVRTKIKSLLFKNRWRKLQQFFQIVTTFLLTCFAWIFFRAENINDAWYIIKKIFSNKLIAAFAHPHFIQDQILIGRGYFNFMVIFFSVIALELIYAYAEKKKIAIEEVLQHTPWYYRWIIYYGVILAIITLSITVPTTFIYFQF